MTTNLKNQQNILLLRRRPPPLLLLIELRLLWIRRLASSNSELRRKYLKIALNFSEYRSIFLKSQSFNDFFQISLAV
jgi:hypothetical protein